MLEFEDYKGKLNALKPTLETLCAALKLDEARAEIVQLEAEAAKPDFWNDVQNSQKILQRTKQLKHKCESYDKLQSSWDDLYTLCEMALDEGDDSMREELIDDFSAFQTKLEEMRLATLLSGEYDNNNAILSFHAGAGGTEAQDWAQMLYRMYMRWAERHGFTFKTMDYLDGDEAGIKSAAVLIEGENAYGYLKSENGVHRLVRISPFDASGRRQTSFAALEVMPDIQDDGNIDIRPEDLKVDTYRSSGAGGQHVNKTESAIRITHIPTGVVVSCQTERSQHQNREYAMRMLRSRLVEIKMQQHAEKISDIKGVQMKIEWGSQIRSYVFMPYTLVKDHRTGHENGNINAVMDGDLDGFINAYLSQNAGQ
ncbi:MAG: peptide chain release factor 2 [Oscillospiraceae bacterium]